MWVLAGSVLLASVLGSMHCVGMCGPLAIWAGGVAADSGTPPAQRSERRANNTILLLTAYHLGRMLTYVLVGLLAGGLGWLVDYGGESVGFQIVAARFVGAMMVLIGLTQILDLSSRFAGPSSAISLRIGAVLAKARPRVARLSPLGRSFSVGLLTAFLPCGWLYLFALLAAGTGSSLSGAAVMLAFWIGTVPALVGLVAGVGSLSRRFTRLVPTLAAILLIVTGCYTATGRGLAQIDAGKWFHDHQHTDVGDLHETTLPCCQQS